MGVVAAGWVRRLPGVVGVVVAGWVRRLLGVLGMLGPADEVGGSTYCNGTMCRLVLHEQEKARAMYLNLLAVVVRGMRASRDPTAAYGFHVFTELYIQMRRLAAIPPGIASRSLAILT